MIKLTKQRKIKIVEQRKKRLSLFTLTKFSKGKNTF